MPSSCDGGRRAARDPPEDEGGGACKAAQAVGSVHAARALACGEEACGPAFAGGVLADADAAVRGMREQGDADLVLWADPIGAS